jgi:hypothetical protein
MRFLCLYKSSKQEGIPPTQTERNGRHGKVGRGLDEVWRAARD